ncbi:hypothetical protein T552_02234 [Pneumocystis carinii B80]|uniref:Uncharacterized protein n=1 Tax=Pneumocystis carinii (strain B80) TaxID=1408658 RepID=A0A0W4ZHF2_PNEC8|nr:hypothetical protein T552_02234 [Pneumocystis carinii B80]KTW27795.1 hypothetical protein T552_02234 [Pneumocystis carinii B80]
MEPSLTAQDCRRKRTHRRSGAVSLDLGFKRTFDNSKDLGQPSSSKGDEVTHDPESRTVEQKGNDTEQLLDLPNTETSTKRRNGFHGWFWAESILSLVYLYFGGSHKKKVPANSVPVVLNMEEHRPPPSSICTVTLQPLIDLDAALLTKPPNSSMFPGSENHQRSRSVTVSSPYFSGSSSTYHSSYKNGYSLRRKMSVIIEDADTISTSLLPSSDGVSDNLQNPQTAEEQSSKVDLTDGKEEIDQKVDFFKKDDILLDNSEKFLKDDQLMADLYNSFPVSCTKDTINHDNTAIKMNQQSIPKNTKGKRKWRRVLGKFMKQKNG